MHLRSFLNLINSFFAIWLNSSQIRVKSWKSNKNMAIKNLPLVAILLAFFLISSIKPSESKQHKRSGIIPSLAFYPGHDYKFHYGKWIILLKTFVLIQCDIKAIKTPKRHLDMLNGIFNSVARNFNTWIRLMSVVSTKKFSIHIVNFKLGRYISTIA